MNTASLLLKAQSFSDQAKAERFETLQNKLYMQKTQCIIEACKLAKNERIFVAYDTIEECIYFEMPFGQCSFHFFYEDWLPDNVVVLNGYTWNGKDNTRELLMKTTLCVYLSV